MIKESDGSKQLDYGKMLSVFHNKHTATMFDRQVFLLRRVCRHNLGGFYIGDLPMIKEFLSLAVQRSREGHPEFVDPVCALLDIMGLPFRQSSANEKILKVESIADTLVTVGNLLLEPQNMIQMAAVDALTRFARAEGCSDPRDVAAMIGIDEDETSKQQEMYLDDARQPARILNQNQLRNSGVLQLVIEALKREVTELLTFDTDGDGQISAAE